MIIIDITAPPNFSAIIRFAAGGGNTGKANRNPKRAPK